MSQTTSHNTYEVMEDDTLWGISRTLFGTGFYYSKIWSLNPYITNPHQIEPGMVLTFSLGSEQALPEIKTGSFSLDPDDPDHVTDSDSTLAKVKDRKKGEYDTSIFSLFAEGEDLP